jgi:endonuclease YncB( thermonuclease family)
VLRPGRDRYNCLLRYAWLDFGNGEVYLVNEAIGRAGYGALYTYPPDVKYVEQIQAANTFAREHQLDLWSACKDAPTMAAWQSGTSSLIPAYDDGAADKVLTEPGEC